MQILMFFHSDLRKILSEVECDPDIVMQVRLIAVIS
jgi:hypothetical protein